MKCLVCQDMELKEHEITPGLRVYNCHVCVGIGLILKIILNGLIGAAIALQIILKEKITVRKYLKVNDSTNPKLCPNCQKILRVYKVANDLTFRLEHCHFCNGIWFDKNEWEVLREKRLHDRVEKIFTNSWQKRLVEEERKEDLEKFYLRKFGAEDYEKIKQVREWLNGKENRSMLITFLMNNDPYKL